MLCELTIPDTYKINDHIDGQMEWLSTAGIRMRGQQTIRWSDDNSTLSLTTLIQRYGGIHEAKLRITIEGLTTAW